MPDSYRDDKAASVEHLQNVLRENEQLRERLRALEAGAGAAPTSRVTLWAVGGLMIVAIGAALALFTAVRRDERVVTAPTRAAPVPTQLPLSPIVAPAAPAVAPTPTVPTTPDPHGRARAEAVLETLQRSGLVTRCWNNALRRDPNHAGERLGVSVEIDASHHAQVAVRDAHDADVARCIQNAASALAFPPGDPVSAEATFQLVAQ